MTNSADESRQPSPAAGANPGYALGQLARALQTSQSHPDPETRARAEQKAVAWAKVFQGMLSGALQVGSRMPLAEVPGWVTLGVLPGGFASGELLAGGPLQEHEQALLAQLPPVAAGAERAALNGYYLSEAGLRVLQQGLVDGRYRITVPEEGALLTVVWLLQNGAGDEARALLDELGPFLGRLRFYPVPEAYPAVAGTVVHVQDVGQARTALQAVRLPREIAVMREAIQVWAPLADRVVALFLETVVGDPPGPRLDPDGQPMRRADGRLEAAGGWPCQQYPAGWQARAQAVLDDYREARQQHALSGKPERPTENFAILRRYLAKCLQDPAALTGREVGQIRAILAAIAAKRGLPASARCEAIRQTQLRQAALPTSHELAPIVLQRLQALPADEGLAEPDAYLHPLTSEETAALDLPTGRPMPRRLRRIVERCRAAPVEELAAAGLLPSGEVLARVIPQITAAARSASFADPNLGRLYAAVYAAFRRRRSLLLLHLAHQNRLEELPWIRAVQPYREANPRTQAQARQVLEQVAALAITSYPHQILPNKLLQELRALADSAGLKLPLVDELAADIFMGTFTEKYLRAAQVAADLLAGTLYERYYGLDYARVRAIDDVAASPYGAPVSPAFARLCHALAGESVPAPRRWNRPAQNGKVIEQQQILTTQNLAVLFTALDLQAPLGPRLPELGKACLKWVCEALQKPNLEWRTELRLVKQSAYAWRQMIFYLALSAREAGPAFLLWAEAHVAQQGLDFQRRFRPALARLASALAGRPGAGAVFLGWTTDRHWLLPARQK